ncbi:FAD-dependent oxidoreductase [Phytoactinopolyspora halotolerans]|uniref:FAD-dependent oxidoreductase n=1 Tax=Phytoactinopolyspora halotolerans TaxID=1981512 RepID=A0A6L9SJL8_9ACTN|nr:FAD-dependent oxidoreductase [Phytoactinopolyspora halotolerans]NEE04592.1 FAD-dependent oxidoreductase [Phytoactinopolyspora halotolerans]
MSELETQLLVVGGGVGGVMAAVTAARRGILVTLTEPTDWLGGVLTTQAVPPDEHVWIEQFGCTATYRAYREAVREYYRQHYPLTDAARQRRALNPGGAKVSDLCHEPRVTLAVLEAMVAPLRGSGRLRILMEHEPVAADTDGDHVTAVTVRNTRTGTSTVVSAQWVIDASETGELLPLAGVEYVSGAEAQSDTGEPHGADVADPLNMQPVSVCFALDHRPGEDHTIDRPDGYEQLQAARAVDWPNGQLSFTAPHPKTRRPVEHQFWPNPDDDPATIRPDYADQRVGSMDRNLWTFRRIAARANFQAGAYPSDITLVNWPQIDYWGGPVYDHPDAAQHARSARELSRSFLYWLQTEAPRPDGGAGWPGLRLRGDVVGDTDDGLAKAPYIRESRRIRAEHTIVEQELSLEVRGAAGAVTYPDSVGIGMYRIDLHPSTGGDPYIDIGCCPFELPLGALLPVRVENLLPGAKNIGTTHITNGAYRMPLVEWNIGEVTGHLVAFCTRRKVSPRQVRADEELLAEFTHELDEAGVERHWPRIAGY